MSDLTLEERVDQLGDEVAELRDLAQDVVDSNRRARRMLVDLLATPEKRPEAHEAAHVEALDGPLTQMLDVLCDAGEADLGMVESLLADLQDGMPEQVAADLEQARWLVMSAMLRQNA